MKLQHMLPGFILLGMLQASGLSAQCSLEGTVRDKQGKALPFVALQLKNTAFSVQSDEQGRYRFNGTACVQHTLLVRALGYREMDTVLNTVTTKTFDPVLVVSNKNLEEVVVQSNRVDQDKGMAYNNMNADQIRQNNLGQDAPYVMGQLTGVVVNSDAGNAIGYTGIRIRGSDATRVNVTVNGVPVNDAESQNTFFVDMPDLVSSLNSIQVQRGVGASSNGAGAFGASINFETQSLKEKAYAGLLTTAGSFNTLRNTLSAGTGLLNNKFAMDIRASGIQSQGYIDRASSNLKSYFLSAVYYHKHSVLKFINFYGKEKTYQAWYYVPEDSIKRGNRTYNMAGEYKDANGIIRYYDNETDNYMQNNFQLHFIHQFSHRLHLNLTAHYTKGKGYYEQYKPGENITVYGLPPYIQPSGDTLLYSDIIRRLWLDNDFGGAIFNLTYRHSSRLQFILGGGANDYIGYHYDRLTWTQYNNTAMDKEYDRNKAEKRDANLYLKAVYKPISRLNIFADMQVRTVNYSFLGFDANLQQQMQNVNYTFYNPKLGLSYDLLNAIKLYASYSAGNKEPGRDDFVQSSPQSRPKSEHLDDIEAGIRYNRNKLEAGLNYYYMNYRDQLVLNGQVNDVGAYNRVNVPESYRRGLEMELTYRPFKILEFTGNLALSVNKIKRFTEFVDSSNADYSVYVQKNFTYENTDISFSPNSVSSLVISLMPVKGLRISLVNKNVSRQFLDNTSKTERSINPYSVLDLRVNYTIKTRLIPELGFMLSVYNLTNLKYETNGYTYSAYMDSSQLKTSNNLATAAGINFLAGISIKFQ
ncbi:MAG TPA: TonB-dependent receptor [Bacteroidia bacterium]|nr:TonB-dependent receptor [Bacteroidia bacterium]